MRRSNGARRVLSIVSTISIMCLALSSPTQVVAQSLVRDSSNHLVSPDMDALDLHLGGRADAIPGKMGTEYSYEWPGVYFVGTFSGDRLVLRFDDKTNIYRLLIDALPPVAIERPGRAQIGVSGLGPGTHTARLEKVTEGIGASGVFAGFYVPHGAGLAAPLPRKRQIEFIGDSSMTGMGIHSPTTECSAEQVHNTTDVQLDYAVLTAKHFDADYQVNSISGRGLIRNYGGENDGPSLSSIYRRVRPSVEGIYKDANWNPQIIVLKLDADFATPLAKAERWKNDDALASDFAQSYGRFVRDLHSRYENASILLWWPDLKPDNVSSYAKGMGAARTAIEQAAQAGDIHLKFLHYPDATALGMSFTGCSHHANVEDHAKVAKYFIDMLDAEPKLWGNAGKP